MASMLANNLRRMVKQPVLANSFYTYANEISHPLNRIPPNGTPEEAVKCIKSGKYKCFDCSRVVGGWIKTPAVNTNETA